MMSFFILIVFSVGGYYLYENIFLPKNDNNSTDGSQLTVSFIDVGQGDATLIECDGEAMLIDAGLYGERYRVLSYLSKKGIERLDYCVATHPHADHIGAMADVIYSFTVDTLVYPACESDSSSWNSVLDAADERNVSYLNPVPEESFSLGSATVTVLSPQKDAEYSNLNNCSLVLKLTHNKVSFLFMGDAESEVEKSLLHSGADLKAQVLKCGHHGSSTSSSYEFIQAINPLAAVISCGKNNDYGHPHRDTLNTLAAQGVTLYRTDLDSTVVATSDGSSVSFNNETTLTVTEGLTESQADHTSATASYQYVGNKNSYIFHLAECGSVKTTKDKNKVYFYTREEAVSLGYSPCKACTP